MSDEEIIRNHDGNSICAYPSSDGRHVVVAVVDEGKDESAMIFLSPEDFDRFFRMASAARVEISKARPQS